MKLPDAELFADAGDPRLLVRAIRIASGPGGKTFTTRQPVTVSEVRIEVK